MHKWICLLFGLSLFACDDEEPGSAADTGDDGADGADDLGGLDVEDTASDAADTGTDGVDDTSDAADTSDAGDDVGDDTSDAAEEPDAPQVAPETPGNFEVGVDDRQLVLTWDASAGANEYIVGRADVAGGPYTDLTPTSDTALTDTGLINRETYYYILRASNDVGDSGNTSEVSGSPYAVRDLCMVGSPSAQRIRPGEEGAPDAVWGPVLPSVWATSALAIDAEAEEYLLVSDDLAGVTGLARDPDGPPVPTRHVNIMDRRDDLATPSDPNDIEVDPRDGRIWLAASNGVYVFEGEAGARQPVQFINIPAIALALDLEHDTVILASNATVVTYAMDAEGDDAPLRTLNGPGPLVGAVDLVYDAEHDEIIAADPNTSSIKFFEYDAEGEDAPARTITLTGIEGLSLSDDLLAYDASRDQVWIYVTLIGGNALRAYDRTDTGDATAERTLTHESLGFSGDMDYDAELDEIIIVSKEGNGGVYVFDGDADGAEEPLRTLADEADEIIGSGAAYHDGLSWVLQHGSLLAFESDAVSGAEPVHSITSSSLSFMLGLAVDGEHDELIVAGDDEVHVFDANADGEDIEPLRTFMDADDLLGHGYGVGYDAENDLIVVASSDGNAVQAFDRLAEGESEAEYTLTGTMSLPLGLLVDSANDQIWVANWTNNTIQTYDWPADGEQEPTSELDLEADESLSSLAWAIAIDPVNRELLVADGSGHTAHFVRIFELEEPYLPLRRLAYQDIAMGYVSGITFCDDIE